jgi:SM-20-related protein
MNPILLDNFFPPELYQRLRSSVRAAPMTYGSKSNRNTDPHGHWSWKPLHDSTYNLADISDQLQMLRLQGHDPGLFAGWNFLRDSSGKRTGGYGFDIASMKLVRCYVNGYTYGTDGYFHTDSDRDGDLTVIIYICGDADASGNNAWPLDWAGETVCTDGKTYWSYLPRANRVVILPSNMLHAARAVSRKCTELRTTLMYKVRPRRSQAFEHQSDWLRERGALAINHSTGSLHDHLMRCHQLLEDKLVSLTTVNHSIIVSAGLHSIYGTNAFAKVLLEATDSNRADVARKFGREAEELAYLFHLLERPKTLEEVKMGEGDCFLEYRFNKFGWHNATVTNALRLIECANLKDQGSLEKWPHLHKLWSTT